MLVDGTHGAILLVDGTDKCRWFLLIVKMVLGGAVVVLLDGLNVARRSCSCA